MSLRKKCTKITGSILAIAVGLLLSGVFFDYLFCEKAAESERVEVNKEKTEKKKTETITKSPSPSPKIKTQQSTIKRRLRRMERMLDKKLENVRRLRHHDNIKTARTKKSD